MPTILEDRIDKKLAIDKDQMNLESTIDQRLGITEEPPAIDPEAERKKINEIIDFADNWQTPINDVSDSYDVIKELEVVDPATSGMGTGEGRPYPLFKTLLARPSLAATEALAPGARRGLLSFVDAQLPEAEFTAPGGLADQIEQAPWYKKLPEVGGWTAEKFMEYKALGFLFKATGLSSLFNTLGTKLASRIAGSELAKIGGKHALLKYGGWNTFRIKVLSSIAKTAPENMAFIATWSSTEAARRGEPIGPAAAKGAIWGLGFSVAIPLVTEGLKAGISTKTFEQIALKIQAKYPRLADFLVGKPEQEFIDATIESLREEAIANGHPMPDSIVFSRLIPQVQNVIKGLARKFKKEWIKSLQRDAAAKKYWAMGAIEREAAAAKPAITGKPPAGAITKPTVAPPVAEVPVEAIKVPPKPAEAVTEGKVIELPDVEKIIKLTPESPELGKIIADIGKQADIAFKQDDLDAMRDIVQLTWELPKTPEADELSRKIQILDGEMLARKRQAKPPTAETVEPESKFEFEKPPEQPEATATLTNEQSAEMLSSEMSLWEKTKESLRGIADAAHQAHDWIFAFGEAKRTMPKLYDELMKSYGRRNAGVEKAIGEVERVIGPEGLSPEDATELSMIFEDKRLSPPDNLKDAYDRFSKLFAEIEKTSQAEGIFEKPFQERMLEEINGQIEKELFKLRSVGKGDSKKLKELLAEEETIKNMRYLPHNVVAQKAIEAKLSTLTGKKRKTFLQNLSRLSSKFKQRKGRLFLKDYLEAGLLKPEDIDIRKLAAEALADYYYRSSIKALYDFANEQGLIQPTSDMLRKEGWMTAREVGITAPELKEKMVHPLLGSSLNELKAMRYRKGGLARRALGMIKIGQFVKPWIIWVYNTVQKYMRGMYGSPITEAKVATEAIKSVINETELYHKLNESNLFQFPYEVSRASRDEQINMMLRRTIADKDSWDKAIVALEKATGTSWATQDVDIRRALMVFYQAIARATWTGDKIQRTQSYLMLRRMSYPHNEAVKVASKGHGAYSILSKKYKEFWSPILFVYSFRMLMPMEMAKTALEPVIGIAEAIFKRQRIPKYKAKRWAKAIVGTIAIPVLVDQYMKARGFEKEGAHLGPLAWKYKKTILDPDTGKESDIIVGMNYILNMPVKYWQRITYYNPIRPEARWQQSLEHLIKWEVHPLWRIFYWDIADNRKSFGSGMQVYNTEDTPLEQVGQIAKYVFGQSLRFWGGMMDAVGEGSMTDKERKDQEKIFEIGLTKFDKILFSVLGYKYTRSNLNERKAIMGKYLLKEIKSRQFNIAKKYEGEEKEKRIIELEKWARRCQKWIETEMK